MKSFLTILAGMTALAIMLMSTGCDSSVLADSSSPPAGKSCTIQFRRDALGAAASLPISPMTGNINGAETTISGALKSTSGEWVILNRAGKDVWIPKSVILLIEF